MSSIAAQAAAWGDKFPAWRLPPTRGGGGQPGTSILAQQFADLRMVVEIAWGGSPTTDPAAWAWTDVTADVQAKTKVNITIGRADEASTTQPAKCTFTVLNTSGDYSKGPASRHHPYVRRNTPVRVRVLSGGVSYTRFFGYAVGFNPTWDVTGKYAVVDIEADGALRRLNQGTDPFQSAMKRFVQSQPSVVAYWPCEDGAQATSFASALAGGQPMTTTSTTPQPASYSGFLASQPIPTLTFETWTARLQMASTTGQVQFFIYIPAGLLPDLTRVATLNTTGSVTRVDIAYTTFAGGGFDLFIYSGNTLLTSFGSMSAPDGHLMLVSLQWQPDAATVVTLTGYDVTLGADAGGISSETGPSHSITGATTVVIAPDANLSGVAVGQVYAQTISAGFFDDPFPPLGVAYNDFVGEAALDRLTRLCSEESEQINVAGSDFDLYVGQALSAMGPQGLNTFVALLRECEAVDGGVLYDGLDAGLSYTWREARENQPPAIVLDASAGDVADPVEPTDDDRLTVNNYTATRTDGSTYNFRDTTSTMGIAAIGDYSSSATINSQTDSVLLDYASWQVHLGTIDDYRYPTLNFKFEEASNVLPAWLRTGMSSRLDLANLAAVRVQQDPKTVSLLVEGWSESIDKFTWHATVNCSPYDPWRVTILAASSGDTGEFLCHLEPDGSNTVGYSPAGSLSLTVATPSSPLWTTAADDFPFDLNIGDVHVTVTNITGASSPQVFTVNATPYPIADGSAVTAWLPRTPSR